MLTRVCLYPCTPAQGLRESGNRYSGNQTGREPFKGKLYTVLCADEPVLHSVVPRDSEKLAACLPNIWRLWQ